VGWSSILGACALVTVAGCRFGLVAGTSRRTGEDKNKTLVHLEGGGYAANGFGGFVLFGGKPNAAEDNDSVHNNDSPWLVGEGRYRYAWDTSVRSRLFAVVGLGLGASRTGLVTEAQLQVGMEIDQSATRSFDLSLRYSPILILPDEHPTYALLLGVSIGAKR
jgi:hypothetical protein